ncbi:hypothetical protein [Saccharothrix hoggarensis]|uniref:Uncharacterized protein n=1 Tax=Saccharothrix hoggarensis TaxID=913853 RepID=A0ABW3QDT6_9PSEU
MPTHPRDSGADPFGDPLPQLALEVRKAEDEMISVDDSAMSPAEECAACPDPIRNGEFVARIDRQWLHVDCAEKKLDAQTEREQWLTLATHIAYTPSKYPAAVVRRVLRILLKYVAERGRTPLGSPKPGTTRLRATKVTADRAEMQVSVRAANGDTRAYVREHGAKGGVKEIGLILSDNDRRALIAALGGTSTGPEVNPS